MESDRQRIELAKIIEFSNPEGRALLEVGCGDGRATEFLFPLAGSIIAIDPDNERILKARSRVPGADFRIGSGEALEFPDSTFDMVAFLFSLHHQDSGKALSEAGRVLRPGGSILIIEPAPYGDMHMLFSIFHFEDNEIEAAQTAIKTCGMGLEGSDTFDIHYTFDDAEDVHGYFFGHYNKPKDESMAARIDEVLGNRIGSKPIILAETVNIFSLRKR